MASYILNWKSGLGNVTLSPTSSISIPKQDGSGNIDFVVLKYDEDDNPVYLLDDDGYKVPSGYQPYFTTAAGDSILIEGFPPGSLPDGVFSYALNLTTIRLGAGSDRLRLFGKGIVQTARTDVSLDSAAGYVFQSSIFAEDGDDYISPLMPWQSVFKGGANTAYANLVLSDSLTLEEVPYGDTIQLKGSRADWDLEFKDGNGDGDVSLASILDERDYIATSNNNRISGFERLLFGDILFDLILYKQLASNAIYGQPEYNLFGNEVAPSLNSSIKGDLWESFRFSRTRMGGAQGTAAAPITIRTGLGADTPTFGIDKDQTLMAGPNGGPAIQYVNLYTEDANDILELGNIENSVVDTGAGEDAVNLRGTARYTRFYGGTGSTDTLSLPKDQKSYGFSVLTDSATGKTYFRDPNNNEYRDIELYVFSDLTITAADLVSLLTVAPEPPPSREGYISRVGWKKNVDRNTALEAGKENVFKIDNERAVKKIYNDSGILIEVPDVSLSETGGYGFSLGTLIGSDLGDTIDIKAFGHVAPTFSNGFKPTYAYPDYYKAFVETKGGDDEIFGYFPYATFFDGGAGEDSILLYGKREDFKLALKAVDGVDVISDANGNTYRNIETFKFGDQDILSDELKKQLATSPDLPNGGGSSEDLLASVVSAYQTPLDAMMLVIGGKYSLPEIRDYDGILHGGASKSVDGDYGFQGFVDVQGDGRKEAVYTNQKSARFVTARVDSFTGQISYPDYGRNGSTRVVGRYIDPLVAEGEAHGGFLLSGEKAPQRGGPHDSQTRFTEDLRRGNLILKAAKDFDADGYQEMYWKLRDGSAYMRGLMHKDGNIQYVNYQSEAQMTDYLSRTGNSALLNYIVY